jgi:hypothetical protein
MFIAPFQLLQRGVLAVLTITASVMLVLLNSLASVTSKDERRMASDAKQRQHHSLINLFRHSFLVGCI